MARLQEREYTRVNDRSIVGSGIAVSPEGIAAFSDLQRAVYEDQPADTQDAQDTAIGAQDTADQAQATGEAAQSSADSANTKADAAQTTADRAEGKAEAAQDRADEAYELADRKVQKDNGPEFSAPSAAPNRSALPSYTGGTAATAYTQADMQAVMDQVAALTSRVAALIVDGRSNHSLTN